MAPRNSLVRSCIYVASRPYLHDQATHNSSPRLEWKCRDRKTKYPFTHTHSHLQLQDSLAGSVRGAAATSTSEQVQPFAFRAPPTTPQNTAFFKIYEVTDAGPQGSAHEYWQSITCSWPHQNFSFEELRLHDYANQRGLVSKVWKAGYHTPGPNIPPDGLVAAGVPSALGWRHTSCRPPAFLDTAFGFESVTLRVGKEGETKDFLVHRTVITRRSAYMQQALKGEWKEAVSGVISFPENEPKVLELYQKWLYTGCIFSDPPRSMRQEAAKEDEHLVKCYIIGEKLLDRYLQGGRGRCHHLTTPQHAPLRPDAHGPPLRLDAAKVAAAQALAGHLHLLRVGIVARRQPRPASGLRHRLESQRDELLAGARAQDVAKVLLEPCSYHEHEDGKCYRVSSVPVVSDSARSVVSALWS